MIEAGRKVGVRNAYNETVVCLRFRPALIDYPNDYTDISFATLPVGLHHARTGDDNADRRNHGHCRAAAL